MNPTTDYQPPALLTSPHVQTVLSSRLIKRLSRRTAAAALPGTETVVLPASLAGGTERLMACVDAGPVDAPLMILIHGWRGAADSPYMERSAKAFRAAGYRVARLLLRDHGGSAHLNEAMFHSGRIDEVVAAINALCTLYPSPGAGLMGYSLGGNFTLRVLAHPALGSHLKAGLAVCPVIDPAPAAQELDAGWYGYRWWFIKKWHRAMREKQAAFPQLYDFGDTFTEQSVVRLTERFVREHTDYPSASDYYRDYTVTNSVLSRINRPTLLLAAADDPVVAIGPVRALEETEHLKIRITKHGGHCAYLDSYWLSSYLDPFSTHHFDALLRASAEVAPTVPLPQANEEYS